MSEQKIHRLVILLFLFFLTIEWILLFFIPVLGILFLLMIICIFMVYTMKDPRIWQIEKRIWTEKWRHISGNREEVNEREHEEYDLIALGSDNPCRYEIKKDVFVIGRSVKCDCVLRDAPTVSKAHCRIVYRKYSHEYYIEDLRSSNGTYLGTRRLEPYAQEKLMENAEVSIGHCRFRFVKRV